MTIKKSYDERDPTAPKVGRVRNNRDDQRVKLALRHADFSALYDDELDDMGVDPDGEDE